MKWACRWSHRSQSMKPGVRCARKPCNHLQWVALALLLMALVSPSAWAAPSLDSRVGIAEGFRNPGAMSDIQAGWERLVLPWDQVQPDGPGDFSHLGITISDTQLQAEITRG